ncbi:MAG: hypothetical protein ACYCZY_12045 [Lacisediminihabitans sp.]
MTQGGGPCDDGRREVLGFEDSENEPFWTEFRSWKTPGIGEWEVGDRRYFSEASLHEFDTLNTEQLLKKSVKTDRAVEREVAIGTAARSLESAEHAVGRLRAGARRVGACAPAPHTT